MKKTNKKEDSEESSISTIEDKNKDVKVVIPLTELVESYHEANAKISEIIQALEPYEEAKEYLRGEIMRTLKERGEYSARLEDTTVTLSVRKTAVVNNLDKLLNDLKRRGLTQYISEDVNREFENLKNKMATGAVTLFDGMAIKESEFVSIRKVDKKDRRRLVTGEYAKIERKK